MLISLSVTVKRAFIVVILLSVYFNDLLFIR